VRVVSPFFVLALAVVGCGVETGEPVGSTGAELRDLDSIEQEFLNILNDYRRANGVGEVMSERALAEGAYDYSQLMGETSHFDHTGPDGSSFDERMCDAGYDPACGPRTFVAENIAAGQRTASEVFEAWRTSPGHNRNMLDSRAVVVGIGRAEVPGSPYGVYWTNTFGGQTTSETVPNEPEPEPDAGSAGETDAGTGGGGEEDAGIVDVMADGGGTGGGGTGAGTGDRTARSRGSCSTSAPGAGARGLPTLAGLAGLLGLVLVRRRRR